MFAPLGIDDFEWVRFPSGDPIAASGLRMRPRDLAKLGQLVLNRGLWNGKQVVPADWISAATSPQINGQQLYFYGSSSGSAAPTHGREMDWAAGVGLGGQRLLIVPAHEIRLAGASRRSAPQK